MAENNEHLEDMSQEPVGFSDKVEKEINEEIAADELVSEEGTPENEVVEGEVFEMTPEEKLKLELAEMKDKYLRLYADLENFRRRTAKERLELISTANADTMKNILPVVDDFERAIKSFDDTTEVKPLKEGVDLIYNKLYKTLESKGLKPMKTLGLPFDAELHESIAQFPAPSPELKGMVVDEVEKGYFLNDKVIRYAKVVVGV
ncbi:nucleotide exchange factor GrpE [Persicitalea sp.]|uniref:nucleotide exchange factor GrpE n=1 Tax=Persicitalea sp. TaxID=3100273 RepID=UPI0035942E4D